MNDLQLGLEYLREAEEIRRRVAGLPKLPKYGDKRLQAKQREITLRCMMYELRTVGKELCWRGGRTR